MRRHMIAAAMALPLLAAPALAQQEALKIGVMVTLSGAGATWGQAMKGSAELAAEDVNKAGGLQVGGKTYRIELIPYDDQFKSSEAITAMNRLISEDKVKLVMGPMGSAPAAALAPITTAAKVLTITMAFTNAAVNKNTPYQYRPVLPTSLFAKAQAAWVVKQLGITRVAGLFPNDETGQAIFRDTETAYEAVGAKFAAREVFERERTDFTPLILRIMGTDAQAIELDGNSPQTAGLIVRQARELGWTKPIIRTGGDALADIVSVAGTSFAEDLYMHQPLDPEKPETKAFIERWTKTFKADMNGFAPFFYVNMHMMFEAMKKAGTVSDPDKIKAALADLKDFPSVLGPVNWTGQELYGTDHQLSAPYYIAQIKGGKAKILATCTAQACQ